VSKGRLLVSSLVTFVPSVAFVAYCLSVTSHGQQLPKLDCRLLSFKRKLFHGRVRILPTHIAISLKCYNESITPECRILLPWKTFTPIFVSLCLLADHIYGRVYETVVICCVSSACRPSQMYCG